jgi:raffinose/stachyose/melibiose transport system substrate-binding protein
MRGDRANLIGLGVLACLFVVATWQVLRRDTAAGRSGKEVIRLAHWQLEAGPRQAIDALIADYEAMHPGVRVEQIAVPPRGYAAWLRTQLVGGTAPELVQVGWGVPGLNDLLARYCTPISAWVMQPNPYNDGTELEGVPWRDTVVDGMSATMVFSQELQEYYSVPLSMFTVRVYYNRDEWRRLFGERPVPGTYEEFAELCEELAGLTNAEGKRWIPIAGARFSGWTLLNRLFASQTQRFDRRFSPGGNFGSTSFDLGIRFLAGEWTYRDPALQAALGLVRDVSRFMQAGFLQVEPGDALFQFLQQRAFMTLDGSYNVTSLADNARFALGVFELPIPMAGHREFGREVIGPVSEATIGAEFPLALTQAAPHPERAMDFLRFLASRPGNAKFTELSGWLPSVLGVPMSERLEPFRPRVRGVSSGFDSRFRILGPDVERITRQNLHRLVGPSGSVEAFTEAVEAAFPSAVRSDLARQAAERLRGAARQDTAIAAYRALAVLDPVFAAKRDQLLENQIDLEATGWWIQRGLREERASTGGAGPPRAGSAGGRD